MSESFLNGKVTLLRGDCLELLPTLEENSIDSCVTDPPYHLTVARRTKPAPFVDNPFGRSRMGYNGDVKPVGGFMGKEWDGGDIAFRPELWAEVLRVLKPGAHLLAFSGTRTYHRMACAIEDAGFEIRDQIGWCYGSGFPKSHDISKAIDRMAGAEREVVGKHPAPAKSIYSQSEIEMSRDVDLTAPATEAAIQWQGWGTALKPAWEPIVLARKPLSESSIASNVLKHGTGAINIDGCRIEGSAQKGAGSIGFGAARDDNYQLGTGRHYQSNGRWPANLIHDGSEEVVRGFPDTGPAQGGNHSGRKETRDGYGFERVEIERPTDSGGSAARFFYTVKADSEDRCGSKHPTVKPIDLLQYLVRLITPGGGSIIDPFGGTGTTGEAAFREGMSCILIEREEEYQSDIVRRMGLCLAGPDERARESIKASGKVEDAGPLFGGVRGI